MQDVLSSLRVSNGTETRALSGAQERPDFVQSSLYMQTRPMASAATYSFVIFIEGIGVTQLEDVTKCRLPRDRVKLVSSSGLPAAVTDLS
jgi:hypothetical protein